MKRLSFFFSSQIFSIMMFFFLFSSISQTFVKADGSIRENLENKSENYVGLEMLPDDSELSSRIKSLRLRFKSTNGEEGLSEEKKEEIYGLLSDEFEKIKNLDDVENLREAIEEADYLLPDILKQFLLDIVSVANTDVDIENKVDLLVESLEENLNVGQERCSALILLIFLTLMLTVVCFLLPFIPPAICLLLPLVAIILEIINLILPCR